MNYTKLPKIELHLHLDCSLSYEVVKQLQPATNLEDFQSAFIAPPKCRDLADYLSRAIKGVELMQSKEQLRLVTLDLFRQLQRDHVLYAEIRFAPLLHVAGGLHAEEVVATINEATAEGMAQTGIEAGLILCTLRHFDPAQSMQTIRLVESFKGTQVVGFDIAADEAGFPIDAHIEAFAYAHQKGIPCTAHAGEAKGPESVRETLQHFKPSRIGHGVRSTEDPALMQQLVKNNIHLEVCPTSNIQTNIYEDMQNHTINQLYQAGVSLSINTDARTISNVRLEDEYRSLEETFHWTKEHFLKCNLEAIKHAFLS